jgi:site-specific recombinase XerC
VSVAAGIPSRIVPHQLRQTYATEMLRSGVSFPALVKLRPHFTPHDVLYLDIVLTDLRREFELARSLVIYHPNRKRTLSRPPPVCAVLLTLCSPLNT